MLLLLLSALTSPGLAITCADYALPVELAEAPDVQSRESSGLAPAHNRPGVWFTHDDSGGDAELYAFTLDGEDAGINEVEGAAFVDWEDIADGPCPDGIESERCLYIGDIGDNRTLRPYVTVYVIAEPGEAEAAPVLRTWHATYPEAPLDSESIAVHPLTGDIHIITKTGEPRSPVWRLPPGMADGETAELEFLGELNTDAATDKRTTSADWDDDGERLIIRTYHSVIEFEVDRCDPVIDWNAPTRVINDVSIGQGEAVGYDTAGDLILTIEGEPLRIFRMACDTPAAAPECPDPDPEPSDSGDADTGEPTQDGGHTDDTDTPTDGGADPDAGGDSGDPGTVSGRPPADDTGCACSDDSGSAAALLLWPLLIPAWRRRRRQD